MPNAIETSRGPTNIYHHNVKSKVIFHDTDLELIKCFSVLNQQPFSGIPIYIKHDMK